MAHPQKVVVRIPPSPTGYFHVGRARTALFNYLFAKSKGGEIVFRIEDTDKERSKSEFEEDIKDALAWLGITYDQGPFRQSERGAVYRSYIEKMLEKGTAYVSHETEGKNTEVIRLKNPNTVITFRDEIRGDISVDTTELGDFVIARNIDDPLYHLTVVVDDFDMGVTHVVRGDDGIANTPRQILIQEAIGAPRPVYAHVPLILGPDKSKMSARHGAVSLRDFREQGYLPEAMVNYLALLGFNPGGEREIYSMEELIEVFDISRIQKGGAVFDYKKLRWMNKEYIRALDREAVRAEAEKRIEHNISDDLLNIIIERIEVFSDIDEMKKAGEFDYYFVAPILEPERIAWKQSSKEEAKANLEAVLPLVGDDAAVMKLAEARGKGSVLWPLRYALSGKEKSPDPFTLMKILGAEESKSRIEKAASLL